MAALRVSIGIAVSAIFLTASLLRASEDTIGPNGINAAVLNGIGLNGSGIAIGQVEPGRPGKHAFDTDPGCCNDQVVPFKVFVKDMDADPNEEITDHAMWVAGVIISKQTKVPAPPPVRSPPIGVAQNSEVDPIGWTANRVE